MKLEIAYGKAGVAFYRSYATPLRGITPIPESPFRGRDNALFAASIDVDVLGDSFRAAYTEGDNRMVVATDTMKNFVYAVALEYEGATLEGFVALLGRRFLTTYPQMEALRIRGREVPLRQASPLVFARGQHDAAVAEVELSRHAGAPAVTAARSGREDMRLIKVTGSSFAKFARDAYTTLPELVDRSLQIRLDGHWTYADLGAGLGEDIAHYVHADQVRDLVEHVFDAFNSKSIQHLVHEIGTRVLERFPQLTEVSFAAENHTPDAVHVSERDERVRVHAEARATYGKISLVMRRD